MRKTLLFFAFILGMQTLFAQNCPPSNDSNVHVVQKGETLFRIAKMYGLTVSELTAMNQLSVSDVLAVCKKLSVKNAGNLQEKGGDVVKNDFNNSANAYQKQAGKSHYVRKGETIDGLAKLYGYTTEKFREINNLASFDRIYVGQSLKNTDCVCATASLPAQEITSESEDRLTNKGGTVNNSNTNTKKTGVVSTTTRNKETKSATNATPTGNGALKLDPAKYPYLKGEELEMIEEINLIRSNPKGYIPYIKEYIKEMRNGNGMSFGDPVATSYELIEQLEETAPLSILVPSECIYTAAKKHGEDRKRAGSNDHVGTDGSWPWDRVLRECSHMRDGNENLVGGPASVRRAVILLLVDDGIPNRGHRTTLLNPNWRYVATYKIGKVGNMPNSWVQKFGY